MSGTVFACANRGCDHFVTQHGWFCDPCIRAQHAPGGLYNPMTGEQEKTIYYLAIRGPYGGVELGVAHATSAEEAVTEASHGRHKPLTVIGVWDKEPLYSEVK